MAFGTKCRTGLSCRTVWRYLRLVLRVVQHVRSFPLSFSSALGWPHSWSCGWNNAADVWLQKRILQHGLCLCHFWKSVQQCHSNKPWWWACHKNYPDMFPKSVGRFLNICATGAASRISKTGTTNLDTQCKMRSAWEVTCRRSYLNMSPRPSLISRGAQAATATKHAHW